jgi:cell wall-associated NlpC family hydrolase
VSLLGGNVAWAEPAAITQAKNEAEALQAKIDDLAEQLDAAVEDYNYAKAKLADTTAAAKKTQSKLTKAEKDLDAIQAQLSDRVVRIYKQGHLGLLDTLAGAVSFSDLINRLDLLEKLSAQDSRLVAEVTDYRDEVAQRKVELADQLREQKVLAAEADKAKDAVQARLSANEKALSGKEAQIAQLEKEEAIRQAKIAAAAREAARKAALAAAKAKAAEAAKKTAKNTSKSNGSTGSGTVTVQVPDNASASDVVSIAMEYLGCPYVWAGSSPSGFDCSGFVMYVYAKVGVSLPHSSRMQIGCGKSVSSGDLKAGDLVFFGNPTIHHVGLYIGDGKMIHAAGVGKGVRIDSVWRSNYHGACRIIL